MIDEDRASSLVVYFDIDEDIRKQRISLRSDADTVERRLEADNRDFYRFENYDLVITNPDFSLNL
jgi:guanylate kinase